jgi:thiamine biosynthesis lipoprotein
MGCQFEIYLCGEDREHLIAVGEDALDEIERLNAQLSHYREDSDIARINRHAQRSWVTVEPELYSLLCRCREWHLASDGAFDITAGPLLRLWGFHHGDHRVPPPHEIEQALRHTGMHRLLFDDQRRMLYFAETGLELNLGAVGKGYALDKAAEVLRMHGIHNALLHGGHSTILALGHHPSGDPWSFDIRSPLDGRILHTVGLSSQALSTSGDEEQFFVQGTTRYSHILDPRTGTPIQNMRRVCTICRSAAESDALSTALFVRGFGWVEAASKICPDLHVTMVFEHNGQEIVKRFPESDNKELQEHHAGH